MKDIKEYIVEDEYIINNPFGYFDIAIEKEHNNFILQRDLQNVAVKIKAAYVNSKIDNQKSIESIRTAVTNFAKYISDCNSKLSGKSALNQDLNNIELLFDNGIINLFQKEKFNQIRKIRNRGEYGIKRITSSDEELLYVCINEFFSFTKKYITKAYNIKDDYFLDLNKLPLGKYEVIEKYETSEHEKELYQLQNRYVLQTKNKLGNISKYIALEYKNEELDYSNHISLADDRTKSKYLKLVDSYPSDNVVTDIQLSKYYIYKVPANSEMLSLIDFENYSTEIKLNIVKEIGKAMLSFQEEDFDGNVHYYRNLRPENVFVEFKNTKVQICLVDAGMIKKDISKEMFNSEQYGTVYVAMNEFDEANNEVPPEFNGVGQSFDVLYEEFGNEYWSYYESYRLGCICDLLFANGMHNKEVYKRNVNNLKLAEMMYSLKNPIESELDDRTSIFDLVKFMEN